MSDKIKFEVWASTWYGVAKARTTITVDREDLEGVPEEKWNDFVWEELDGKQAALEMVEVGISRIED